MSRAQMNAWIEADQDQADAAWERLSPERQQELMDATARLCTWIDAMLDDQWRRDTDDEIDSLPEQLVLFEGEYDEDTDDYASWQDEVEWLRHGGN